MKANKTVSRVDSYPPSRVVDLKVVAMEFYNMTVTLQWTAPGDDLDSGKGEALHQSHPLKFKKKIILLFCYFVILFCYFVIVFCYFVILTFFICTVSFYRLKYSDNSDDVFNENFQLGTGAIELVAGNVYQGSLEPLEAGNVQTVTFYLPLANINTTYYFALRAYDDANKTSPTSNVASIQIVTYFSSLRGVVHSKKSEKSEKNPKKSGKNLED